MEQISGAQVTTAIACVALAGLLVQLTRLMEPKLRIARGLAPLNGPKGVPLLGILPQLVKNQDRVYDFLVRMSEWDLCNDTLKCYCVGLTRLRLQCVFIGRLAQAVWRTHEAAVASLHRRRDLRKRASLFI